MYIDSLVKLVSRVFASGTPLLAGRGGSKDLLPEYPAGIGPALYDGTTHCIFPAPTPHFDASRFVGPNASAPAIWYQIAASTHAYEEGCECTYARYYALGPSPGSSSSSKSSKAAGAGAPDFALENVCTRADPSGNGTRTTTSVRGVARSVAARYGAGAYRVRIEGPVRPPSPAPAATSGEGDGKDDAAGEEQSAGQGQGQGQTQGWSQEDDTRTCGPDAPNLILARAYTLANGESSTSPYNDSDSDEDKEYDVIILGQPNFSGWFLLSRERRDIPRARIEAYLKDIASLGFDLAKPYALTEQGAGVCDNVDPSFPSS